MKAHAPYQITHLALENQGFTLPHLTTQEQGNYLVFWWDQLALGHLFLAPNSEISPETYPALVLKAIQPAIDHYATSIGAPADWIHKFKPEEPQQWVSWLEKIIAPQLPASVPAQVKVSVVICTRNRAPQLERCLAMLRDLKCLPREVIVVDNAPSDSSTQQVAQKFEEVTYVKEPRPGLDFARNTGVKNASTPLVAFVDDDVVVHPLWVYRVWETFQNPCTAAMTGLVIASELASEAQYIFEQHWSFNRGYQDKWYDDAFFNSNLTLGPPVWEIGAGANMAFRKAVFEQVGYFDEILDVGAAGCNGDSEMWFRILAHGLTVHYNPRAIVHHEHRRELSGLKKQIFFYMRGFTAAALLQQQQQPRANYKRRLGRVFPKYYLFLALRGFPFYRNRTSTLWAEMKGILSGYRYYRKNWQNSSVSPNGISPSKSKPKAEKVLTPLP
ncbi:glycosyltransferase family 2 protein [Rufibacter sediminis]|uniref:Glycosyltransferase n=1 Tax=Rufibacter sediminis TaxID=2762756 RepID=A0ABR6VQ56_9BACT|nr:glycosyltransferase family 2 protein [Rufibacter sediminis]MBC3539276.1 glycosyltransferase [Rufibacter sediminis]